MQTKRFPSSPFDLRRVSPVSALFGFGQPSAFALLSGGESRNLVLPLRFLFSTRRTHFWLALFPEFWFDAVDAAARPLSRAICSTSFLHATSTT